MKRSPTEEAELLKGFEALPTKYQRGSRLRCILFTNGTRVKVARRFEHLAQIDGSSVAIVDPERHGWVPEGLARIDEVELARPSRFLSADQDEELKTWWLKNVANSHFPSWDLACQATIDGREGLILVEAKAHTSELDKAGKQPGGFENALHIGGALFTANFFLNETLPGWSLTTQKHYQLANRFAWAWKLCSMGVPVVLIFLGFLEAREMADLGKPLLDRDHWRQVMLSHAAGVVPERVWDCRTQVGAVGLHALIRAEPFGMPACIQEKLSVRRSGGQASSQRRR